MSVTFEQTEKVETGLDVAIKAEDGRVIAWAYNIKMASEICYRLNNAWRKSDGSIRCATCEPIPHNTQDQESP